MRKILTSIIFCIIIILNGCSWIPRYCWDEEFYNGKYKINWYEKAGFYESNYPDLTRNQKALILIETMAEDNQEFQVIYKYYKIKQIKIMQNLRTIWPIIEEKIDGEELETSIIIVDKKLDREN